MRALPSIPKCLRWATCLVLVVLSLGLSVNGARAQWLKNLFHRASPAPAPAPAPAPTPAPSSDFDPPFGGYVAKQRYDSLTRGTQHDQAKLLALVKPFCEKQYPPVTGSVPTIPGAEMVNDDTLCATCHEAYVKYHRTNIHRNQSCEACHGPASEHLKTRGTKPGTILNLKNLKGPDQAEVCLRCHEKFARRHPGAEVANVCPCPRGRFLHRLPQEPLQCAGRHAGHPGRHEDREAG